MAGGRQAQLSSELDSKTFLVCVWTQDGLFLLKRSLCMVVGPCLFLLEIVFWGQWCTQEVLQQVWDGVWAMPALGPSALWVWGRDPNRVMSTRGPGFRVWVSGWWKPLFLPSKPPCLFSQQLRSCEFLLPAIAATILISLVSFGVIQYTFLCHPISVGFYQSRHQNQLSTVGFFLSCVSISMMSWYWQWMAFWGACDKRKAGS